jgi:hypothetical protein
MTLVCAVTLRSLEISDIPFMLRTGLGLWQNVRGVLRAFQVHELYYL